MAFLGALRIWAVRFLVIFSKEHFVRVEKIPQVVLSEKKKKKITP